MPKPLLDDVLPYGCGNGNSISSSNSSSYNQALLCCSDEEEEDESESDFDEGVEFDVVDRERLQIVEAGPGPFRFLDACGGDMQGLRATAASTFAKLRVFHAGRHSLDPMRVEVVAWRMLDGVWTTKHAAGHESLGRLGLRSGDRLVVYIRPAAQAGA